MMWTYGRNAIGTLLVPFCLVACANGGSGTSRQDAGETPRDGSSGDGSGADASTTDSGARDGARDGSSSDGGGGPTSCLASSPVEWLFSNNGNETGGRFVLTPMGTGVTYVEDRRGASTQALSVGGMGWMYADDTMGSFFDNLSMTMSIEVWVQIADATVRGRIVDKLDSTLPGSGGFMMSIRDGIPLFWIHQEMQARATTAIPTGAWVHVVGTYTGGASQPFALYVNGAAQATTTITTSATTTITPTNIAVRVGADSLTPTSSMFTGKIDDLRIYNCALTPAQVTTRYTQTRAP